MKSGFPNSSVGKEFACNAGDPGSIPGLGRSAEKGIRYPLLMRKKKKKSMLLNL